MTAWRPCKPEVARCKERLVSYYGLIYRRAFTEVVREIRQHLVRQIVGLVISGLLLWLFVPLGQWLERLPDSFLYPAATLVLYVVVLFLWHLVKAPAEIQADQEEEIRHRRPELPLIKVGLDSRPRVFQIPKVRESEPSSSSGRFIVVNNVMVRNDVSEDLSLSIRLHLLGVAMGKRTQYSFDVEAEQLPLEAWEKRRTLIGESATQILPSPLCLPRGTHHGYMAFRIGQILEFVLEAIAADWPDNLPWQLEISDSTGRIRVNIPISIRTEALVGPLAMLFKRRAADRRHTAPEVARPTAP